MKWKRMNFDIKVFRIILQIGWDTNVTKLYRINKYVIHPQYDGNYNDIAVCEIWGKFQYGVKIGPACLPFYHKNDLFIGSYVKLLG